MKYQEGQCVYKELPSKASASMRHVREMVFQDLLVRKLAPSVNTDRIGIT